MDVRILGPLSDPGPAGGLGGGSTACLGGTKQRALLAMLVLHANQVVAIDWLVDGLWGQAPPDSATNVVQVYVSRLRKALHAASPGQQPSGQQPSGQQAQGSSPLSCSTAVPGTSWSLDPTSLTWTVSSGSLVRARGATSSA
jgi:hypothetical protein